MTGNLEADITYFREHGADADYVYKTYYSNEICRQKFDYYWNEYRAPKYFMDMKGITVHTELLNSSNDPELMVAMAAKLCYSKSDLKTLRNNITPEVIEKMINMLNDLGHESPLEHVSFTFGVEGVSRITEQQLTRHRVASYSIQSGRYVKRQPMYTVPNRIKSNPKAMSIAMEAMNQSVDSYLKIIDVLQESGLNEKEAIEDARYFLLNSLQTKIIFTMNLRELKHFLNERLCNRAQWEIRALANQVYSIMRVKYPLLAVGLGPKCINGGLCKEGKMTCGKPLK